MRYWGYCCRAVWLFLFLESAAFSVAAVGFSAGSGQATEALHFSPEQIIQFAKKVEKALAAKGAYVAVVARMGRPVADLPEGMHYTHAAFAVYSEITTQDGRKLPGYAMYNLYQKDGAVDQSDLVQDFPVDFFAGVAELEAGVLIPSPELQERLLATINSPTYRVLHDPHYSVIANPYTVGKQNCTEFVLDVINAAIYQTGDLKKIKANTKAYFVGQKVQVNPLKLLFGSLFSKEVSLADQSDTPITATFETIAKYLEQYDEGAASFVVTPLLN